MAISTYRLALAGFGAVGQGLAQILHERAAWLAHQYAIKLPIIAVATRRWGAYQPDGLDPAALLEAARTATFTTLPGARQWSPADMIAQAEADILIEVSPTNLQTAEPASGHIRAALARGWHVVTANKGPVALYGRELQALAQTAGVGFGFEGTVLSGTPALRLGLSDLAGCQLRQVRGIVNGTTNYILSEMDGGRSYAAALAEAQRLGYAEADPTADVEGHDAAGKAVILANMLFGAALRPADVATRGITGISQADVAAAFTAGERWKLIAQVAREGDQVVASVQPLRLPISHPLAGVTGALNAICYSTDLLGDVTLIGPGAGGVATGFALLADMLAINRACH